MSEAFFSYYGKSINVSPKLCSLSDPSCFQIWQNIIHWKIKQYKLEMRLPKKTCEISEFEFDSFFEKKII